MSPNDPVAQKLFEKLDEHAEVLTGLRVDVAVIKQKLESVPPHPTRPCTQLAEHLKQHKEARTIWKRPIVGAVVDMAKMIGVGLLCFWWGKR